MASTIAWQILDDHEDMINDDEFSSEAEANENLLDTIAKAAKTHVSAAGKDIFAFQDDSIIIFNGHSLSAF